jgi:hypothetical protein
MQVSPLAVSGTNADQFRFVSTTSSTACPIDGSTAITTLAAGASCGVTVAFRPIAIGAKSARVVVGASDPITSAVLNPVTVSLSGTATQATISVPSTTIAITGRNGRSTPVTFKVTNTGTANLSLVGSPALMFWDPATHTRVTTRFSATSTCTNIAPRKTCNVTILFTPGPGTIGQTYVTDLYMFSNASNLTIDPRTGQPAQGVKLRVTGTRIR